MAQVLDLEIDQGSDCTFRIEFEFNNNECFSLSNAVFIMQLRTRYESTVLLDELSTDNGRIIQNDNSIYLSFPANITAKAKWCNAVYDIEATDQGKTLRMVEGKIKLRKEVTR